MDYKTQCISMSMTIIIAIHCYRTAMQFIGAMDSRKLNNNSIIRVIDN